MLAKGAAFCRERVADRSNQGQSSCEASASVHLLALGWCFHQPGTQAEGQHMLFFVVTHHTAAFR